MIFWRNIIIGAVTLFTTISLTSFLILKVLGWIAGIMCIGSAIFHAIFYHRVRRAFEEGRIIRRP